MLMFEVFNYLWRHSHIPARRKPCALTFQIVPGDREFGFMEFMADSAPVRGCVADRHGDDGLNIHGQVQSNPILIRFNPI